MARKMCYCQCLLTTRMDGWNVELSYNVYIYIFVRIGILAWIERTIYIMRYNVVWTSLAISWCNGISFDRPNQQSDPENLPCRSESIQASPSRAAFIMYSSASSRKSRCRNCWSAKEPSLGHVVWHSLVPTWAGAPKQCHFTWENMWKQWWYMMIIN